MLPTRAFLAALLMISVGFAGCIGDDADAGLDSQATEGSESGAAGEAGGAGGEGVLNESEVPNDDGSNEMAMDLGHQPHLHDYWNGRERVTLYDGDVEPDEGEIIFTTFIMAFSGQPGKAGGAFFELPDGAIVYEGTGQMEITVSWTDPTVTGVEAYYSSAQGPDYTGPVQLQPGSPSTIDVTPQMTDMPHMSTSKWAFAFFPSAQPGAILGPFHLKIDIVKMRDIAKFPGHPELFNGKSEKVILDQDGVSERQNLALRFVNFLANSGSEQDNSLTPDELVPMETESMKVELEIKSTEATAGGVSNVHVMYRSADSWNWRRADHVSGSLEEGRFVFTLPVEMRQVDSPYGEESQWRFQVWASTSLTGDGSFNCGGCVDSQVDYHMTVTAFDHPFQG